MQQKITQNQLVKYLYKETSTTEKLAVDAALNEDWRLFEAYEELLQAKQELPKVSFSPSNSTIQNILSHSAQTAVELHP